MIDSTVSRASSTGQSAVSAIAAVPSIAQLPVAVPARARRCRARSRFAPAWIVGLQQTSAARMWGSGNWAESSRDSSFNQRTLRRRAERSGTENGVETVRTRHRQWLFVLYRRSTPRSGARRSRPTSPSRRWNRLTSTNRSYLPDRAESRSDRLDSREVIARQSGLVGIW